MKTHFTSLLIVYCVILSCIIPYIYCHNTDQSKALAIYEPERRRLRSRCPNILYERRGRIRPRKNKRIARINIQDNMIISLDVTINGWPRSHWGNIIHCGTRNTIRQPGLWLNRNSKYLHIVYGTTKNWNKLKNLHRVKLGRKYKIMWKIKRNRYDVYIDGRRWFTVRGRHRNHRNQPCYLSDPWHEAANAYVENLKIIKGTDPSGGCRRRGKCNERLRGRKDNGYRGCQTRTVGGYTCQRWTSQSPHRHGNTPSRRRGKGLGSHNYCRNPDGERTIWCYTTNKRKRWDYCKPKTTKKKKRRRKKRKRRRKRKKKKRRKKRKRRRKRRRKKDKQFDGWKCTTHKLGDRDRRECIRMKMDARRGRRNRILMRWYRRMRRRGYKNRIRGMGNGFRKGYKMGKRFAMKRLRRRNRMRSGMPQARLRMPKLRLPKIRMPRLRASRFPRPPRIKLIDVN